MNEMGVISSDPMEGLVGFKNFKAYRVSSWDRSGRNRDRLTLDAGSTTTIAEIKGPGMISHIWVTVSCKDKNYLRKLVFLTGMLVLNLLLRLISINQVKEQIKLKTMARLLRKSKIMV